MWKELDEFHCAHGVNHVIEGGAKGADSLGMLWAIYSDIPFTQVKAEWDLFGKRAGFLRNVKMADMKPDAVLAFTNKDVESKGTHMMLDIANKRGIPVYHWIYPP